MWHKTCIPEECVSFAVCQPKFALANAGDLFMMLFSYLPSNQSPLIAPRQAGSNAYAPAMLLFGMHDCKSRPEHAEPMVITAAFQ